MTSMKQALLAGLGAAALLAGPHAFAATYTTFNAPGSKGTIVVDMNLKGDIAGYSADGVSSQHYFVRASDGTYAFFSPDMGVQIGPISDRRRTTGDANTQNTDFGII